MKKDEIIYWFVYGIHEKFINLDINNIVDMCYFDEIKEKLPSCFKNNIRETLIKHIENLECRGESFSLSPDGIVCYKFFRNKVSYIQKCLQNNIDTAMRTLFNFKNKVNRCLNQNKQ